MTENRTGRRFLSVFDRTSVSPPPVWLMRQAGRYLPEYLETRKKAGSFWMMCMTPDLAEEVTLQPIRRFDLDAAILFSDILVIPFALGQDVRFEDGTGPILAPLPTMSALDPNEGVWRERLAPVYEAVSRLRAKLAADKALIGFAGAPWTLAAYMIEGHGTKDQAAARLHAYRNPENFSVLLDLLAHAVARHLIAQIEAGADAVQIFDSWAGGLPDVMFADCVVAPTRKVVAEVRTVYPKARILGFPRQATQEGLVLYARETGVDGISIDTGTSMSWAARRLSPDTIIQGNLDPMALVAGGEVLDRDVDRILDATKNVPFIFNLGHGVVPQTPPAHVAQVVSRIRVAKRDRW
jgi:uroporphyrinogen decarboxylase